MASAGRFDLLLMDINMPEMSGPEAARRLRRQGLEVPIVATTASARPAERERCLQSGMSGFLAKPFTRKDLALLLRSHLGVSPEASGQTAAPEPASIPEPASPPGGAAQIMDYPAAVRTFMGEEDTVRSLLAGFLDRTGARLAELRAAAARGDGEALQMEAHAIKGGAINLSANRLAAAALALEGIARGGRLAEAAAGIEALETELAGLTDFAAARGIRKGQ
jgi:HPt (histidine-containing phosphotransfer) domain-containing protein